MAIDLVLRFLEMNVSGSADRLAQFLTQTDDGTVELLQVFLRLHLSLADHKLVVAEGLDLQKIVIVRDALQLVPVLVVLHCLEQFARLTGGTYNDTLTVLVQQRLGDRGHTLEILQIGGGDHLVQVLQAHLVAGQQDDVLGEAVGLAAQGTQLLHLAVDRLQGMDPPLMEHLPERDQHIAHRSSIITGTVVVKGGQIQMLRHDVQLVFAQFRKQILGQNQGIHIGRVKFQTHFFVFFPDEADIKLGVVGRQRTAVDELQEVFQGNFQLRCVLQHLIRNAGETDDLRRQTAIGVDEGLEPLRDLAVLHHNRTDFRNGLPVHLQAGSLDVETDKLVIQRLVLFSVDHDAVVQIIDKIALHTVEDLDFIPRGVPCVRERLGAAVVRDGNGGMAPADGLLNDLLGVRQGIGVAHLGM